MIVTGSFGLCEISFHQRIAPGRQKWPRAICFCGGVLFIGHRPKTVHDGLYSLPFGLMMVYCLAYSLALQGILAKNSSPAHFAGYFTRQEVVCSRWSAQEVMNRQQKEDMMVLAWCQFRPRNGKRSLYRDARAKRIA